MEAAEGIEPPSPGSKPDAQPAVLYRYLVGQVGFGPTVFLMSRFYRPLPSPIWILTHVVAGAGFEPASSAHEAVKETTPLTRNMVRLTGLEPALVS